MAGLVLFRQDYPVALAIQKLVLVSEATTASAVLLTAKFAARTAGTTAKPRTDRAIRK